MECHWDAALLRYGGQLPAELIEVLRSSSNDRYLETITAAALDGRYTDLLLAHCEPLFAHLCSRFRRHGDFTTSMAAFGRIVPFAPLFAPYATKLLQAEPDYLRQATDSEQRLSCLLAFYRLLKYDRRIFRGHVEPFDVSPLLLDGNKTVVYMTIRILQILLDGSDHWFEQMIESHIGVDGQQPLDGSWDDRRIDYRFLTLWEERRGKTYREFLASTRSTTSFDQKDTRILPLTSFDPSATLIGDSLFPAGPQQTSQTTPFVITSTVQQNMVSISAALKSTQPLLLTGLPGCGKTTLVEYVANKLGKANQMVTLHINEQSDAKLLIGIYTTGDTPGSFVWKPGVLTTAVQEGRWLLIEDIDRAPNDIIGTLLPLIEKRELSIPSRKQLIHAAEGFRIVATARTTMNHRGDQVSPLASMVGARKWQAIHLKAPPFVELSEMAEQLFPSLQAHLPRFTAVYERLQSTRQRAVLAGRSKAGVLRSISSREFLKWCSRVQGLLRYKTSFSSSDLDDIFMEAIDCFVGALPEGDARQYMTSIIAEELHIDPQRRNFLVAEREIKYAADSDQIIAGRYCIPRSNVHKKTKLQQGTFAINAHTSRMLERAAAAVANREPLLLVGETGVGKTTAVQHLAFDLGKKLEVFNLSQQSEAGDLLGGFKPVTPRGTIVPLKDEFDDLFQASFSQSKNQQFIDLLNKQMARSNWKAVCKLWQQALKMVDQHRRASPERDGEAPSKKRRIEQIALDLPRWDEFAAKVSDVERRLQAGSSSFAFTFMEGNIVKAVRNGDWVLLDEINLASLDTLESIVDLLDPSGASLMLTEAGSVDRVRAHPDFRVFAAMNPATDVGKKDLPPGIRSRFTELYVESPDRDTKSLQSIVRSYLRSEIAADPATAIDVSHLYQKIIALAETNKLVDGSGQRPHFSLRTLTRTLTYAKHIAPQCTLRRALYEGFQMGFLTFLNQESASIVDPLLVEHLFKKKSNLRAELQKALRKPEDGHRYVQGHPASKHWVRQGTSPLEDQPHYILTPFIQANMENLVRAASARRFPVLIQGPTSSGKTSMIEYLARRTGHRFVRINNHEHTDLQEYLGMYISGADGKLVFQEGLLVKALREGHWIVLDELNLAPTDVLEALNRLLDDNRELLIPETQETVRPHEDFMLFATQNPAGLYGGRKTLSRAFRNRFLELHFDDIPIHELQEILHRRTQLPESRCRRIVTVYRELSVLRQENRMFESRSFATLRDLFRWALRPNDTIEDLAANGFMLLAERVRTSAERETLKAIIEKAMSTKGPHVTINEGALYSMTTKEIQQYEQSTTGGVVWTKAMRRLYVLVSRAVSNNEAVLLVGETGCGKTTVCQMLADALAKQLLTVNAHQNTETGDLIGSQRPVRNRGTIETELRNLLMSAPELVELQDTPERSTQELLDAYDTALAQLPEGERSQYQSSPRHAELLRQRIRFNALFEWSDGPLIQAMKEGNFFLLDEISLADDSVLERLNSVLESERSMVLAEKGSIDAFVQAVAGFQFFATMNPGGDYGKRELSPALRNRFTEIWVPALSDRDDMVQIVESKLVEHAKPAASVLVSFAQWFRDAYNTSASSSVSLRDLLAWVEFINVSHDLDLAAACVNGASMVYIDTLGANPAGLMALTGRSIEEERAACISQLSRLMQLDVDNIVKMPLSVALTESAFSIGPFAAARRIRETSSAVHFTFDAPTSRRNAMRVLRAMQLSKPVMLEGSPGVGKTALVTAIAAALNISLVRINLSEQTDMMDLLGSDRPIEGATSGSFSWRDAPFLRAMKRGDWVLLDEMNLASQSVLEGLNACLDHRGEVYIPELGQTFSKHPDFRLFAAQNPHHQGGGRKGLPASFVNRFTVVYAESFHIQDLIFICSQIFPSADLQLIESAAGFVNALERATSHRGSFATNGGPWEFNLRDISRWLSLATQTDTPLAAGSIADFIDLLFFQRFRTLQDREHGESAMLSEFTDPGALATLVSTVSSRHLQLGLALLPRDSQTMQDHPRQSWVPTSSMHLRTLQAVMIAIQQSWPVVLTGPSGVGKTALLEHLAATVGAPLTTISINADTDAMDLIGGYEQSDRGRQLVKACHGMIHQLQSILKTSFLARTATSQTLDLLQQLRRVTSTFSRGDLEQLASTLSAFPTPEAQKVLVAIQQAAQSIDQGRFEWLDGHLIEALEQGRWVILDNANLCSGAVLDRLNSLLEPNGMLIVNEESESDGSPRCVRPHPNFRIFLTLDPRYGELSRAIRNRAVELYMIPDAKALPSLQPLAQESRMTRFRSLLSLSSLRVDESTSLISTQIFHEHFAFIDQPLIERFNKQVHHGLTELPFEFGAVQYAPDASETIPSRVRGLYTAAVGHHQDMADFIDAQTLHPLNNQAIIQPQTQIMQHASFLSLVWEISTLWDGLLAVLRLSSSSSKLQQKLSRIQRAVVSSNQRYDAGSILTGLGTTLHGILQELHHSDVTSIQDLSLFRAHINHVAAVVASFVSAVQQSNIDLTTLQAWMSLMSNLLERIAGSEDGTSPAFQHLAHYVSTFNLAGQHVQGSGMSSLWRAFRPPTCSTLEQLASLLKFEQVVNLFDDTCRRYELPLNTMSELRSSFARVLQAAMHGQSDVEQLSAHLESLLPHKLESGEIPAREGPHFREIFDQLCCRLALHIAPGVWMTARQFSTLEILAGRPTTLSLWQLSRGDNRTPALRDVAVILPCLSTQGSETGGDHIDFVQSLLARTATVRHVALDNIELLRSEQEVLGKTLAVSAGILCKKETVETKALLHALLDQALDAVAASSNSVVVKEASQLMAALKSDNDSDSAISHAELQVLRGFSTTVEYCRKKADASSDDLEAAASAWLSFAADCLMLYVPTQVFDPALGPRLAREVHRYSFNRLTKTKATLQRMQMTWTNEQDNLRTRILAQDLSRLGPEPTVDAVCRPATSELAKLQGEFDNLNRILALVREQSSSAKKVMWSSNLKANILQVRQRLALHYRAYTDLTGPVVSFIDCLRISWLFQGRAQALVDATSDRQSIVSLTPFVGATPRVWLSDGEFTSLLTQNSSSQERLFSLSLVASRVTVQGDARTSRALRESINQQFVWFHDQWHKRLSQDQKTAAAKSSLYRYQGDENLVEDESDEAIEQLFPEHALEDRDKQSTSPSAPQNLATTLSEAHHTIFTRQNDGKTTAATLLRKLAQIPSTFSPDVQAAVPTLLVLLREKSKSALQGSEAGQLYDMYTDANVPEVRRLAALLRKIQKRFNELHIAWPEHATPIDVLRHCQQILACSHSEPLTKFFPLLEKLHGTMAEWQKVASREYSAAQLFDDVTDLIVHWRKTELSSWAGLLARESASCENGAKSWWFVAFETIIAATHVLRDSPSELEQHTQGLLSTLEAFMLGCGLGEYAPRLQILRDFQAHLESDSANYPSLRTVSDALTNFICYFERFTPNVEDALAKGRAALEKEIRNVVQVASWKDRNIEILRQSAKSSHRKLLRLVRKFRMLLAKPVEPVIQSSYPQLVKSDLTSARTEDDVSTTERSVAVQNVQAVTSWVSRPARYHDVAATASLLGSYVARIIKRCDAPSRVFTFVSELLSDIRELQKATPDVLTEENKTVVQHLKTRKRRLLADVLKETRMMGFKTNLSEDILTKQGSRALVLARLPALPKTSNISVAHEGELSFYKLLGMMPNAREDARKHSEDLTPTEASRCLTLLESMLSSLIALRRKLAQQMQRSAALSKTIRQMRTFAICSGPLHTTGSSSDLLKRIHVTLYWLESTIELVSYQGQLGQRDFSTVLQSLESYASDARALREAYTAQPSLPPLITSEVLESLESQYHTLLHDIGGFLEQSSTRHDELYPVLRHLQDWCQSPQHGNTPANGVSGTSIEDWIVKLFGVLDHALSGVQQMQHLDVNISGSSEASWLLQQQSLLERQLMSLHTMQVSTSLQQALDQLHTLQGEHALQAAAEACLAQLPIVEAFSGGFNTLLSKYADLYMQMSTMASELAQSFSVIAQRGFCTPGEKSNSNEKDSGQAEAGTGLGDGEGAEDVSKDIQDDEDLSELAQTAQKKEGGEDIEREKDAVDMADEELEGEMDEGEAKDEDGEESDDGEQDGAEMDEEAGNVDDMGPSAVDEKMWDEAKSEELREKEGDRAESKSKEEDLAAAEQDGKDAPEEGDQEDDMVGEESGADEKDAVSRQEMEKMDPHVQDQDNLDLPEDMDMDADKQDVDDMSDIASISDHVDEQGAEDATNDQEATADDEQDAGSVMNDDLGEDAEETQEAEQPSSPGHDEFEDARSDILMQDDVDDASKDLDDNVFGETGSAPNEEPNGKDSAKAAAPQQAEQDDGSAANEPGTDGTSGKGQRKGDEGGEKDQQEDKSQLQYKQIGDALEEWYKQHRPIQAAQAEEDDESQPKDQDMDMAEAEFEHLPDDNAKADTQVLGAATAEQSTALDENTGVPINDELRDDRPAMDDTIEEEEMKTGDNTQGQAGVNDAPQRDAGPKAFVGESTTDNNDTAMEDAPERSDDDLDNVDDVDQQLTNTHINQQQQVEEMAMEEARSLWATHEASTRNLALVLTEHLRLILQPTQATKMRGDFRTGKRLNIKRIIPYIASSYKRDKIWMRRSVPSKRAYQIMLAIDDSQSMSESNSRNLAFETLTLVAKALSMLEVGELSVVRFGNTTDVVHDFSTPLTSDSGAHIIQQFTFNQAKTDVRRLLTESIELFRTARLKAAAGSASDLWQLQLIISDGVCQDHSRIRQLVRQAHEERIMVVFIVVDMLGPSSSSFGSGGGIVEGERGKKQSIVDLQAAEFVKDAGGTEEMKLRMVKYLDTFPFRHYLIVRDVQELPGVLAGALRQWFAEVVDTA